MFEAWGGREKVKFWSDYHTTQRLDEDVKKIWIGSVESIVCSRGRSFFGWKVGSLVVIELFYDLGFHRMQQD
jgi:hypothetical protein